MNDDDHDDDDKIKQMEMKRQKKEKKKMMKKKKKKKKILDDDDNKNIEGDVGTDHNKNNDDDEHDDDDDNINTATVVKDRDLTSSSIEKKNSTDKENENEGEKKKKKKKKKRKTEHDVSDDDDDNKLDVKKTIATDSENNVKEITSTCDEEDKKKNDTTTSTTEEKTTTAKKDVRTKRRAERDELKDQVPKIDKDTGRAYTKQEIRRMCKRVKAGLDPIETPRERHERIQSDIQLKKEERDELAGLLYNNSDDKEKQQQQKEQQAESMNEDDDNKDNTDHDNDEEDQHDDDGDVADSTLQNDNGNVHDADEEDKSIGKKRKMDNDDENNKKGEEGDQCKILPPPTKITKLRNTKPVPLDYVCSACQNRHTPMHWIYDCPDKVTVRGTNKLSSKQKNTKGLINPNHCKVFVSGLPFDATNEKVTKLFTTNTLYDNGKVTKCKLVLFQDSKRCKGQAYLTFETDQHAKNALKLNGMYLDKNDMTRLNHQQHEISNNNNNHDDQKKKREQLKLKVTQALNRFVTKHRKSTTNNKKKSFQ